MYKKLGLKVQGYENNNKSQLSTNLFSFSGSYASKFSSNATA
jgi:hypothetical protein